MNNLSIQHPSILIVDDEEDLLKLMKYKLTAEGFAVDISPNGANVIDLVHDHHPDLILLDIHMDDMDGGTICRLLKINKSTATIPIFMFSANDNIKLITEQCGANGFIQKPFDIKKVKDLLMNVVVQHVA